VTVCLNDRQNLFGIIEDGQVSLYDSGRMIKRWWEELEKKYNNIRLNPFCIMPNHIHGIIQITVEDMVRWFKTMTTNEYIANVKNNHWRPFFKRLWQRNYYEHIVRDEIDLNRIREYIANNPVKWETDEYYVQ
jgi:putative transposase